MPEARNGDAGLTKARRQQQKAAKGVNMSTASAAKSILLITESSYSVSNHYHRLFNRMKIIISWPVLAANRRPIILLSVINAMLSLCR